jgi:Mn2+/Fe2+ NRAMP family transporter
MKYSSQILGAAFLMATSAIGPGFLTQTVVFTQSLTVNFGFVILISIVLDLGAQLNIWKILTLKNKRAQDLANDVKFGLGHFLAFCILFGGLSFNIGNIAGCGLGMQILTGMEVWQGALLSALFSLLIFWSKEAGKMMDWVAQLLGILMIGFALYVAIVSQPPISQAVYHSFLPAKVDFIAILTLVGGTVGGYISFAGAHRLLDAGVVGLAHQSQVRQGAIQAILLASLMRILLFLGALGVVMSGKTLLSDNPPASVFQWAAGEWGYRFFGVVLWSAAITSVLGSAYTSISFLKTFHPWLEKNQSLLVSIFISFSCAFFIFWGKPVQLLMWAGFINGFILPLALGIILIALESSSQPRHPYPFSLKLFGWIVVACMTFMGIYGVLIAK